jgi:hypothetical protein
MTCVSGFEGPAPLGQRFRERAQGSFADIQRNGFVCVARREEQFILNPRRLLVAISRSRLLTIVVCSTALFEVAPADAERLNNGPVWARLFTHAVGRDPDPAWAGPLGEFTPTEQSDYGDVPVTVYPSSAPTEQTSGDGP